MTPPSNLLLACLPDAADADLEAWLRASAALTVERCACRDLVQRAREWGPDQVVVAADAWGDAVAQAIAPWNARPPCPVTLVTPSIDEAAASAAVEAGVHHWLAAAAASRADALSGALAWARARHARASRLQDERATALAQLDERKWIDRAKGVLMSARGLSEDEAFRLLRGAAMNVNLRLGVISRAVTEAAQWADAVNRAGQLRMLSQRLVRLAAQRLLGIDARGGRTLHDDSVRRVQENLDVLSATCEGTDATQALARVRGAWTALRGALQAAPEASEMADVDARAERLREAAERLTDDLEALAGRRALHIVNLCGRQRMHVLRAAKCGLLAALAIAPAVTDAALAELQAALDAFEAAQRELEAAPLASPQIRASLDAVRDEWLRLLAGLRGADPRDGQRALVHASEVLLAHLDELTAAYEHSLQVIMG